MITSLRIQNFKGWKDTGAIRMAPITLFFGANSSGKSSIGQFMMMLKQTAESPDLKAVLYPGGKNSAAQLGSFHEMVFGHDTSHKIEFRYQWQIPDALEIKDSASGKTFSGNELAFEAKVGVENKASRAVVVEKFCYDLTESGTKSLCVGMEQKADQQTEYEVKSSGYKLAHKRGRAWPLGAPLRFYGFPNEVVAYYKNADFMQEISLQHEKLFRSIYYLGPLRTKGERLYSWTGIEPESVGYSGENTVSALLAARNRKIAIDRKHAKPFEEVIALKLKELGLIEEFSVKPISETRQEYEVKVKTKGAKEFVDLPDVGFGVSQVLPVLVQCFYAPPGSVIIMEQPEIHLHPRAQAALADVLIDVINSREDKANRGIQLIIETHSEHFLRRLQRKIAEDKIPSSAISAYFANITRSPAVLEPLQIDDFGNISNWPENFFGDEMDDILAQTEAAMKKRSKLRDNRAGATS